MSWNIKLFGVFLVSFFVPIIYENVNALEAHALPPNKEEVKPPTNLAASYYFDSREYNTLAVNYSSKNLPYGLQFWGFTDLHGVQKQKGEPEDLTRTSAHDLTEWFTENRLTKMMGNGFGVQLEHNDKGLALGVSYRF
jgi:hypothetical protein